MSALATYALGTVGLPSTLVRGAPTVAVTSPLSVVTASPITVTWSYTSPIARAQEAYRVRLLNVDQTFTFYDSGIQSGAAGTFDVPFGLHAFTNYAVSVEAYDGLDWSDAAIQPFEYQPSDQTATTDPNLQVGSVYEVAINGVGLMLADHPEKGDTYRRQNAQLDPQRFATGDTPFSESVERYTFIGHQDWSGGEGQEYLDRERSLASRYEYSEGVDPFEFGQLACLPEMEIGAASASTGQPLIRTAAPGVFGYLTPVDTWWFKTGASELTKWDGTTATAFDPGGTVLSLTTDGFYWYVSTGADIYRGDTAATPGAPWSTENMANIYWAADRLVGIPFAATDSLSTFDTAGAVVDTFQHLGARINGATGGDGYLWYGVLRGTSCEVRAWQLDSTDQPFIAFTLPEGDAIVQLYFYLGNVFISTREGRIYRCVPNEGRLTASVVLDEPTFVGVGGFAGNGSKVAFTWLNMELDGSGGIGVIDLESGGYARWLSSENADDTLLVDGVAPYNDQFCFTVRTEGLYIPTTTLRSGLLRTSISDLASGTRKVFDSIKVSSQPLNGEIEVLYSIDSNQTFHSLGSHDSTGALSREFQIGLSAEAIGLEFRLTPDTLSPVLLLAQVKLHPVGLVDQLVTMAVNVANEQLGMNGQPLPLNGPERGQSLARWLESVLSTNVLFQDIDWPVTRQAQTFQVTAVDYRPVGVFNRHLNRREDGGVVVVSLRRAL